MGKYKKDFPYRKGMYLVSKYYKPAKIVKIVDIKMPDPDSWISLPIFYLKGKNSSRRFGVESIKRDFRIATPDEIKFVGLLYE